jgi:hypothetical protein
MTDAPAATRSFADIFAAAVRLVQPAPTAQDIEADVYLMMRHGWEAEKGTPQDLLTLLTSADQAKTLPPFTPSLLLVMNAAVGQACSYGTPEVARDLIDFVVEHAPDSTGEMEANFGEMLGNAAVRFVRDGKADALRALCAVFPPAAPIMQEATERMASQFVLNMEEKKETCGDIAALLAASPATIYAVASKLARVESRVLGNALGEAPQAFAQAMPLLAVLRINNYAGIAARQAALTGILQVQDLVALLDPQDKDLQKVMAHGFINALREMTTGPHGGRRIMGVLETLSDRPVLLDDGDPRTLRDILASTIVLAAENEGELLMKRLVVVAGKVPAVAREMHNAVERAGTLTTEHLPRIVTQLAGTPYLQRMNGRRLGKMAAGFVQNGDAAQLAAILPVLEKDAPSTVREIAEHIGVAVSSLEENKLGERFDAVANVLARNERVRASVWAAIDDRRTETTPGALPAFRGG